MTKIKLLNDRIIFDGHADSRQECETITLMCDNLAKSKDFKTVRYESGYAEFEKVGKTDELKFPPYSQNVNFIFDSTISSILLTAGSTNTDNSLPATITESGGSSVRFGSAISGEPATTTTICTLTIADGYELDTINVTVSDESLGSASNFIISNKTSTGFTFYSSAEDTTWYTVTLTTKAIVQKQTIDVSTLSGWANLATGNHQITVKTKASGYADSASSNAVTVAKAAVVSAGKLYFSGDEEMGNTPTATVNGAAVSNGYQLKFGDVIVITTTNGDSSGYRINGKYIGDILGDYTTPYVVNWTEGGDINYTEIGMGPGIANQITINYLNPTT